MELQQIYYVLEVAKHKSFSKAAEALYVSQSSISRRILALEKELNVRLFKRDTHSVSLTKDGEDFCHYAQTVTDTLKALQDHFRATKDYASAPLRIAVFPFYKMSNLRQLLNDYMARTPELSIDITVLDTHPALDLLEKGELDFAFIKGPIPSKSNLSFIELTKEFSYLLTKEDFLPGITSIHTDMISDLSLHIGRKNTPSQALAANYFQNHGISLKESPYDTYDADIILDLVRSASTNVLVSESIANKCTGNGIKAIPIDKDCSIALMSTYLVYPKSKGKTLRSAHTAFRSYILDSFQNN
ncbi:MULTISPECIES: LysR family transcriptional regulator [Clostridia]|nr:MULTISPECIES: LysR family transcriptional regulator [Clostridia]